jgi:hypothetical protein
VALAPILDLRGRAAGLPLPPEVVQASCSSPTHRGPSAGLRPRQASDSRTAKPHSGKCATNGDARRGGHRDEPARQPHNTMGRRRLLQTHLGAAGVGCNQTCRVRGGQGNPAESEALEHEPRFSAEWPPRRNRSLGGRGPERNGVLARRGLYL